MIFVRNVGAMGSARIFLHYNTAGSHILSQNDRRTHWVCFDQTLHSTCKQSEHSAEHDSFYFSLHARPPAPDNTRS